MLPVLLLSVNQASCFDITELKGTFEPLKQELKHVSPIHGVIWWESGVAQEYFTEVPNPDATKRLARLLFHDIQGMLDIAQHDQKIAYYLTPAVIGSIIGVLESARCSNIVNKNQLQEMLCQGIYASEELFDLNQHCYDLDQKIQEKELLISQKSMIEKALGQFKGHLIKNCKMNPKEVGKLAPGQLFEEAQKIPQSDRANLTIFSIPEDELRHYNHQAITKAIKSLEQEITILNNAAQNIKRNDLKSQTVLFVATLIEALDQCGFFTTQSAEGYLPFTPYGLLLAFLYKKAESRGDLWHYFISLEQILNRSVFSDVIDENSWKASSFTQDEAEKMIKSFEKFSVHTVFSIDDCLKNYENWIFAHLFLKKSDLPNKTFFRTVPSFHIKYPDCAETVIRALCNILMYDKDSQSFLIDQLLRTCPLIKRDNLDEAFLKFYSPQANNGLISDNIRNDRSERYGVHGAWAPVVEDLSWVCYKQLVDRQSHKIFTAPEKFNGFISFKDSIGNAIESEEGLEYIFPSTTVATTTIDEKAFATISIAGQKYCVFDPEKFYAVEVAPSLKNTIIVINKLLGLNLFGDMTNAFFNKNFNSKYFDSLCKIFGWTVADKSILDDDLKVRKPKCCIKITTSHDASFEIGFSKKHARWAPGMSKLLTTNPIQNIIIALSKSLPYIVNNQLENNHAGIFSLSNLFFIYSNNEKNLENFLLKPDIRADVFNFLHSLYNQTAKIQRNNEQGNFDRIIHEKLVIFIVYTIARLDEKFSGSQELSAFKPLINLITILAQGLSCHDDCLGLVTVLGSLIKTKITIQPDVFKNLVESLLQKVKQEGSIKALCNLHMISVENDHYIYPYEQTRAFILDSLQNNQILKELFLLIQVVAYKGVDFDLCMQSVKSSLSQDIPTQIYHMMVLTQLLENWNSQQIYADHQARLHELVDLTHKRIEEALKLKHTDDTLTKQLLDTLIKQSLMAAYQLACKHKLKNELLDIIATMKFLDTSPKKQQINFFKDLVSLDAPQAYFLTKATEVAFRYSNIAEIVGVRKEALSLLCNIIDRNGYTDNVCNIANNALVDESVTIRTQALSLFRKIIQSITGRLNELQPDKITMILDQITQSAQSTLKYEDEKIKASGTKLYEMVQKAQRQLSGVNKRKTRCESSLQQTRKKRKEQ